MKTVGLITEYNPFHNGHLFHIERAKEVTGADTVIVVMSGDYVQRGTPSMMPKALRAEMALQCGASAVFELPVCYATGSAELFAMGAVSLLDSLNVVDAICFGSESNDIKGLTALAALLHDEPPKYKELLQAGIRKGLSFPAARHQAVADYENGRDYSALLKDPNNILGIEYLKALKALNSTITPFSIQREDSQYHDTALGGRFSSATAIRSLLAYSSSALSTYDGGESFSNTPLSNILTELEDQVPPQCLALLKDYHKVKYPIYQNDFSLLLKYKLLNKTPRDLIHYMDVSRDLANRICKQLNSFFNFKQFCGLLKTKEITYTRINRALLHIMLGTKKGNVFEYTENGYHFYARLLGFRKDREKLLSEISKKSHIPLLTKLSANENLSALGKRMLYHDTLSSNLYASVVTDKFKTAYENEYHQAIVKL